MRTYFVKVPSWARLLYPEAIWTQEESETANRALWTIDDGPDSESTPLWLKLLRERNQKAIFFLLGSKCEQYPELVDLILSEGHRIGSHGYDHLDGWKTSTDTYIADVQRSLGIIDTNMFRPPYGRMRPGQYRKIKEQCDIMMWSIMPGDFDTSVNDVLLRSRIENVHHRDILVFHDRLSWVQKVAQCCDFVINN